MKPALRLASFLLLLATGLGPVLPLHAAADRPVAAPSASARARQLAADVHEFAATPGLSRARREKRIATAVRTAVVAATAYRRDPADALAAASELAAAAAQAAPAFTDVIVKAAALAPGVARIDGAAGSIRAAATAAPKTRPARATARAATRAVEAEAATPRRTAAVRRTPAPRSAPAAETAADEQPAPLEPRDPADLPEAPDRWRGRHPAEDAAVAVTATLDLTARRDDNVFLTPTAPVSDTIISAAPGVALRWGDKSRTHGSLGYTESFDRYLDKTSPNVALGTGAFTFGFNTGQTNGGVTADYRQLYQSNTDVVAAGQPDRIRTNLGSAAANVEFAPWAKVGGRLGLSYADTSYRNTGLVGNTQLAVPASVVLFTTPKTDVSLGYTFSTQRPDGGGESSKDHYFNVGARGEFTPKLSGSLDVGYQSRHVGANPAEHLVAFNSSFNYELTPRTRLTLAASRAFNASALGASTKNSSYRLGLVAELSPQLELGATAGYLANEYGAGVFRADQVVPPARTDHLWEASFSARYLFTEWFTTSAVYNLRHNQSTLSTVDFSSNVISLTLGLKY